MGNIAPQQRSAAAKSSSAAGKRQLRLLRRRRRQRLRRLRRAPSSPFLHTAAALRGCCGLQCGTHCPLLCFAPAGGSLDSVFFSSCLSLFLSVVDSASASSSALLLSPTHFFCWCSSVSHRQLFTSPFPSIPFRVTCSGEREREKTTSSVASVHKIEHSYRERERERQCIQWVPDAEEESSLVKPVAEKMMMMMVMVKEGGDGDHYLHHNPSE